MKKIITKAVKLIEMYFNGSGVEMNIEKCIEILNQYKNSLKIKTIFLFLLKMEHLHYLYFDKYYMKYYLFLDNL